MEKAALRAVARAFGINYRWLVKLLVTGILVHSGEYLLGGRIAKEG
jgi:hypothetical protein